ncbi:MAG: sulfatase [Deltaproteobacteria bacterium]|nr:sulfatase [Deltaproteobacteria bacterium]
MWTSLVTTKAVVLASALLLASGCSRGAGSPAGPPDSGQEQEASPPDSGQEPEAGPPDSGPAPAAYNIVFILSDDQRADSTACMTKLQKHLAAEGVTFRNNFGTTPLCCPGRSTVLTGRYAHNHGVKSNGDIEEGDTDKTPGAVIFKNHGNEERVFARWLGDQGYLTGFFGKYLNGYPALTDADSDGNGKPDNYIPPYWDEWRAFPHADFFNFQLVERGAGETETRRVCYLSSSATTLADRTRCIENADAVVDDGGENYSDDMLKDKVIDFIARASATGKPFFVYFAPKAPHAPALSPGRYQSDPDVYQYTPEALERLKDCALFEWAARPPSFMEPDVSDKPEWVVDLVGNATREGLDEKRKRQLVSVLATDDAVEDIMTALQALGIKEKTVVFHTSDNGYAWGEHWYGKKNCGYEECIRLPLTVFHPGNPIPGRVVEDAMLMNADLAATFADLAGAAVPGDVLMNGSSFAGLLDGTLQSWPRDEVLTECWSPRYIIASVRTLRWKYVEYYDDDAWTIVHMRSSDGRQELELYDLEQDPHELQNLAWATPAELATWGYAAGEVEAAVADLKARLASLKAQ